MNDETNSNHIPGDEAGFDVKPGDPVPAEDTEGPDPEDDIDGEDMDPSVPTDLLELHVALEETGVDPSVFKEVYGDASGN